MFKRIFIISLSFLLYNIASAQTKSYKLSGTIISYDQRDQLEAFNPAKAFDGDLNTYFKSDGDFGNWIGYDLGSAHIITSVEFYSRQDNKPQEYAARLLLGVVEGANNPDFGDAIALGIISEAPTEGLNTLNIQSSKGFRYVRFIFPNKEKPHENKGLSKYIAEFRFFGYEGAGDNSKLPTLTNLPTVNIHTVNAEDVVSKTETIKGVISFVYEDGTQFYSDSLEIRGRGNNSWTYPKKPYRLKFYKSTKLMGLPAKAKKWTLINNYGDKTLMRNILAFDFARKLEMPYTSPAIAVDVVLNGDYKGCYQLCDQIDVRSGRIDITEMGKNDLTGGYLIEIDAYADAEPKMFTSQAYNIPVTIKYPDDDEITIEQELYIENHFNKFANSVQAANYKDKNNGFRKYLDMYAFLRHFLVGEFSGNTDTYWSVRMFKEKDEDKFVISPVWDFDLAFENDWRTHPIIQNTVNKYNNQWMSMWDSGTSAAGNTKGMLRRIFTDNDVVAELEGVYAYYRDRKIITNEIIQNVVDSCRNLLFDSQDLNFKRWPIIDDKVHENPVIYGSYDGEVNNVKNYIEDRLEWLDSKLNYVPSDINGTKSTKFNENISVFVRNNLIQIFADSEYHFTVLDLYGRTVKSKTMINSDESISFKVNSGIYLIKFENNQNDIFVSKYIVK